ncbi:hypothetical protein M0R04_03440 [Candidatus Dojkabacteria bacterium]|jgi:hypothetical protein|nr:hypothetical protein [Candidatus Dojkabacteria bacterium]
MKYLQNAIEMFRYVKHFSPESENSHTIDRKDTLLNNEEILQVFGYEVPDTDCAKDVAIDIILNNSKDRQYITLQNCKFDTQIQIEILEDGAIYISYSPEDFNEVGRHTKIEPNMPDYFTLIDKKVFNNGETFTHERPFQISDSNDVINPNVPIPITQERLIKSIFDSLYKGDSYITITKETT